jgi:hypothetical protein
MGTDWLFQLQKPDARVFPKKALRELDLSGLSDNCGNWWWCQHCSVNSIIGEEEKFTACTFFVQWKWCCTGESSLCAIGVRGCKEKWCKWSVLYDCQVLLQCVINGSQLDIIYKCTFFMLGHLLQFPQLLVSFDEAIEFWRSLWWGGYYVVSLSILDLKGVWRFFG